MPLDLPGLVVTVKLHGQTVVVSHGARMPVYRITRIKERLEIDVILVLPDISVATKQMYTLLDLTRLSKFMIIHISHIISFPSFRQWKELQWKPMDHMSILVGSLWWKG